MFIPKLVASLVILLMAYLLAEVVSRVVDGVLEGVGFVGWVGRALRRAFARSSFDPSGVIAVVVLWAILPIALQLAFGVFGPHPISGLLQGLIAYLPNVLVAIIILVSAAAAEVVTQILTVTFGAVSGGEWIARGAGIAILVVGMFAALDQLRIAPAIVDSLFYAILVTIAAPSSCHSAAASRGAPLPRRLGPEGRAKNASGS